MDAFCLMGLVEQAKGDVTEAERYFQRALYLTPRHHESLVHMILIARQRGDVTAADNYRRRAEQAQGGGDDA